MSTNKQPESISQLTLRDVFAAAAMIGHMAGHGIVGTQAEVSGQCYKWADAMIAARAKESHEHK